MKIAKKILLALIVVLVVIQFFRPERNVSDIVPVTDIITSLNPSKEVAGILQSSCYDCHSNNTVYPWYSNIAPISFWLAEHIKDGKKHLDFSQWESYSAKKKAHKMEELAEEVKEHKMPLESYLWVHGEAKLSEKQISLLTEWANGLQLKFELEEKRQAGLQP